VFGREQGETALTVLLMVNEVLNTNDPSSLHTDLVKIQSEASLTVIPNFPSASSGDEDKLSNVGKALVLFAIIFVVSAALWLYVARRKRDSLRKSETMSGMYKSKSSRSKNTLYSRVFARKSRNKYKDYNPEANSIKPSMEAEAAAFGAAGSSRLLVSDGRPVDVDFDETSSNNTSVMDSHMEMSLDPRAEYI
jgi:hypothetical protein